MIYLTCSLLIIPALIIAICYTHIVYTIWSKGQLSSGANKQKIKSKLNKQALQKGELSDRTDTAIKIKLPNLDQQQQQQLNGDERKTETSSTASGLEDVVVVAGQEKRTITIAEGPKAANYCGSTYPNEPKYNDDFNHEIPIGKLYFLSPVNQTKKVSIFKY